MDRIDIISYGMFIITMMGIAGMYIGAIDLTGVVTIEGLAVAVSIAAGQLQKYKCEVCGYYQFVQSNLEKFNEFVKGRQVV